LRVKQTTKWRSFLFQKFKFVDKLNCTSYPYYIFLPKKFNSILLLRCWKIIKWDLEFCIRFATRVHHIFMDRFVCLTRFLIFKANFARKVGYTVPNVFNAVNPKITLRLNYFICFCISDNLLINILENRLYFIRI